MSVAQIRNNRSALTLRRHISRHDAFLDASIQAIGLARRRINFENPVPVQITDLDFMNERFRLFVDLLNRKGLCLRIATDQRDNTLIVGRDGDDWRTIAIEVADFYISHSAELATEVLLPNGLRNRAILTRRPKLERGFGPGRTQQLILTPRNRVHHGLVKDVALRILHQINFPLALLSNQEL